jgi:2'-5' RNA ligase
MPRIRTFIAIPVGDEVRQRLVELQETLAEVAPGVKWVQPANIHLTLLFLGEVDSRELPAICRAVQNTVADHNGFSITVEGAGCFPNARRPRVLWVGIGQGQQEVVAIHDALEKPLLELGCYRREERRYTPHVTLGRIEGNAGTDALSRELAKQKAWKAGELAVDEIHVMSSELRSEGPIYSVLSRARLA